MESGYKLRRTDRGWHQWEMACITDREVELFFKRHELIDTLSEERQSTPEEERRIAQQERDSKTTKFFHGKAEIENWRQQMGPERWDSITPEGAKEGPQLELPINPREVAVDGSHVTTDQAKREEEQLLDLVRGGWDTCKPIGRAFELDLAKLTEEQRKALKHILASRDLVMDVSEIAGAGKSHLLKQVEGAASSMGKSIAILSPTDASVKEGKNVFTNNDIAEVQEITDTELVLHDGRRMRRDGARINQGVCITFHASQCRTVDQVVVLPDGADAKAWYVSLSRARESMHVYTRNKADLRQSVKQPGERKSVWELVQALRRSKLQSRDRAMPNLWAARQAQIDRSDGMER
jgi:hypothetical protein